MSLHSQEPFALVPMSYMNLAAERTATIWMIGYLLNNRSYIYLHKGNDQEQPEATKVLLQLVFVQAEVIAVTDTSVVIA